ALLRVLSRRDRNCETRLAAGCCSLPRLANRARARAAAQFLLRRSCDEGHACCLHHSQHGLSGTVRQRRSRSRRDSCCDVHAERNGILWEREFPQGGNRLLRLRHNRQQTLRPGDPDSGVWLRSGWSCPQPERSSRWDSQRCGLCRVESRKGSLSSREILAKRFERKTRLQAGSAATLQLTL